MKGWRVRLESVWKISGCARRVGGELGGQTWRLARSAWRVAWRAFQVKLFFKAKQKPKCIHLAVPSTRLCCANAADERRREHRVRQMDEQADTERAGLGCGWPLNVKRCTLKGVVDGPFNAQSTQRQNIERWGGTAMRQQALSRQMHGF